jgi:uncharacterized membrane protein YhaH (DUF805 family)
MPVESAQAVDTSGLAAMLSIPMMLFWLVVIVAAIAGMWMMFEKAGRPGWAAIIPIYNVYVLLKVADMSGWWLLAFFVPIVDVVVAVWMTWKVSKAFGHGFGYFLGLLFLSPIFYMIIGFGKSQYQLPKYEHHHETSGAMPTPA